jgi:choline-sulfatase
VSRPFRYTFIVSLVALATGLAALGGWRYARASAPVTGPIILISVEGLRADRLPVYGYAGVSTPAIDSLAADGVVFERAYSHVPQTLPAHMAILSGRLPFESRVRDETALVNDRERLVAELLRDRGYATGAVVSSYALRSETGIGQGFGFFDDRLEGEAGNVGAGLWRAGDLSESIAEQWLSQAGDSRVFLFLHVYEPHTQPLSALEPANPDPYDAKVARTDAVVGRLIRHLKSHQLYDRSTIILVSDHGEGLGDHGEQEHGLFVYEEALRVPLIIKQAAAEGAGRRVDQPVQHVDLVPTLLDFAKAPGPGGLKGRSLKPLLEGPERLSGRRLIYSESLYGRLHFGWQELVTLTDGKHRYVRAPREELYDLEADPAQQHNLAPSDPSLPSWRKELSAFDTKMTVEARAVSTGAAAQERLAALGHVSGYRAATQPATEGIDPKDGVAQIEIRRTAAKLSTARRYSEAIAYLQAAVRKDPDALDLWVQFARVLSRAGRDEQALAAYRRIIALVPADETARLEAAAALLRLRRLDEARQNATVVAEAGENADMQAAAQVLLADIALARGDAERARLAALRARVLDAALPLADYVEARLLYDAGSFAEALPLFEKVVATAKESRGPMPDVHYYAGRALEMLGRDEDARAHFEAELEEFPDHTRARAALAAVYHRAGRDEDAAAAVRALTTVSPTPEAYRTAARLWESFGESARALEARAAARRLTTERFLSPAQTTRR